MQNRKQKVVSVGTHELIECMYGGLSMIMLSLPCQGCILVVVALVSKCLELIKEVHLKKKKF